MAASGKDRGCGACHLTRREKPLLEETNFCLFDYCSIHSISGALVPLRNLDRILGCGRPSRHFQVANFVGAAFHQLCNRFAIGLEIFEFRRPDFLHHIGDLARNFEFSVSGSVLLLALFGGRKAARISSQ